MSLYVTVPEFKSAPTGIDTANLDQTAYGNMAAQDVSLLNILRRASAWVDSIVQMDTLEATENTETKEVRPSRDGRVHVHVNQAPIIQLQSVQYRTHPREDYREVDLHTIEVKDTWFTIYDNAYLTDFSTGLANFNAYTGEIYVGFNTPYNRKADVPLTVKYTYLNGWANTTLAIAAEEGANTITVVDSIGITEGDRVTIYDGALQETVLVSAVNGNVLTLRNALLFGHGAGVGVSEIPEAVKQATILLACALIKDRGSMAITMQEGAVMNVNASPNHTTEIELAKQLLNRYKRVVTS